MNEILNIICWVFLGIGVIVMIGTFIKIVIKGRRKKK